MLMQCPRCKLVAEVEAAARCRNCNTELVTMEREDSAPHEALEHAKTNKRPTDPIRHD